jgi:hypothetical protein
VANAQAGIDPYEAERQAKIDHLFLPDEEDVPLLGENPDALPDPANLMTTPGVSRRKRTQKQNGPRVN